MGESMCERCAVYKQLLDSSAELIQTIILSTMRRLEAQEDR